MTPLSRQSRFLLHLAGRLVPAADRHDWHRCWQAELWHRSHPRQTQGATRSAADLYPGLVCDAVWMRTHAWQQALRGTALLCLLLLAAALLGCALPLVWVLGGVHAMLPWATHAIVRLLCESLPISMVGFAVSSRTVQYDAIASRPRVGVYLFQAAKIVLVLLAAFCGSTDISQSLRDAHPLVADILQSQTFVIASLLALRWSFLDLEGRCRHCLRRLAAPERVGRPSWNFLEANGTELQCREGHGLLRIPELETSWCRARRWIAA